MDAAAIIIILMLCCCIMILVGGLGFFILKTPTEKGTPSIILDGVTVEADRASTTENYTYDELSKNIKLNIKWSNGSDFDDVTNVYFTRTHGTNTEKKETDANGRKSNTTGNKIQFVQKTGEDMRGKHTIKVTYKLKGQTQEKVMTTFEVNVSEDQLTLAADSVNPVSVSYSPTTVPFSTEVETQKTTATLNPNPTDFGKLFFVPSGDNNAIKIKRVSDGKFLTHSATWGATGGVFYVQSSAGDKRRISTTADDDGKLLTSVGPSIKKYTDMNPEERQKSLFTITFATYVPDAVDCVYTESDEFTPCASIYWSLPASRRLNSGIPACGSGAGEQYKRINVVTEPKHGGAACPLRGETRACDIECEDCRGEFKPVVKGGHSNAWFKYNMKWATTRYDVTSPAGIGGAACPYRDGQKISKILKNASGVNYDYGTDCGKYVGQGGDSTKDDVFGTKLVSNHEDIQNFDATVESYHKVQDKVWCAVHK
ncbi:hypothetical protein AP053_gp004 [Ostreococcus mediterraneus virus 1]|uniref:hypothetical protein n=1 Tax=Ostreococcus mediterraneus virus 1 TaxID=1663210 RepID=UPI0006D1983E|nr:hypothetical protein AP053_gp004 [Ostreococcus mediterraneus virus 1]ALI95115.1 hypothetical protein OmV1_004c [Ostreococcus mediterraneus virus 1]